MASAHWADGMRSKAGGDQENWPGAPGGGRQALGFPLPPSSSHLHSRQFARILNQESDREGKGHTLKVVNKLKQGFFKK